MEYLINRNDVEIYIQDTKVIDMYEFKDEDNVIQYNSGKDYAAETVAHLVDEMSNRYEYLKKHGFKSLVECNRKDKPNQIFLVIEELASFNPKEDKEFYKYLAELLAKGRAAGIGIIITSQACYSDVLPGMLKNNINTILGLKTRTGEASKVISGNYDLLTGLRGKGHGYLINAAGTEEVQVFNID